MARHAVERPHWQHADGHRYDEVDFGFTRFVDDADVAADALREHRPRRIASTLRRVFHFRPDSVTDTTHISR